MDHRPLELSESETRLYVNIVSINNLPMLLRTTRNVCPALMSRYEKSGGQGGRFGARILVGMGE